MDGAFFHPEIFEFLDGERVEYALKVPMWKWLGLLPVIGVPLPLMSAGLASLIATFIAIGFAISVQLRRFVN